MLLTLDRQYGVGFVLICGRGCQSVTDNHQTPPRKGDQYEYPDGTVEIVFAVEDGRVLTIREYPDVESFTGDVDDAASAGTHEGVADLPEAEFFEDLE